MGVIEIASSAIPPRNDVVVRGLRSISIGVIVSAGQQSVAIPGHGGIAMLTRNDTCIKREPVKVKAALR
mgnify:CR=1 FL=1